MNLSTIYVVTNYIFLVVVYRNQMCLLTQAVMQDLIRLVDPGF